jgi:hypothetical protein
MSPGRIDFSLTVLGGAGLGLLTAFPARAN